MKKIFTLLAVGFAFLATTNMTAQQKKTDKEIFAETKRQVEQLSDKLELDVEGQKRMQRSLYAYNLNTEVHINHASQQDDAYYANKNKFETSLLSTTKEFLSEEQYEKFLKAIDISVKK